MVHSDLPTYTIPEEVYASFFYRATGATVVDKTVLATAPSSYPPVSNLQTSQTTALDTSFLVTLPVVTHSPIYLDTVPAPLFEDIHGAQATELPILLDAGSYPVSTLTQLSKYTTVAQTASDTATSSIAIIGLATGGAIIIAIALTVTVITCTRRHRSGRYRQNSVIGPAREIPPLCMIEVASDQEKINDLPSSLKSSPNSCRFGSNRSRHIAWKDQVFDQSFITLPPLPGHLGSLGLPILPQSGIEGGAQEPDSPSFAVFLPRRPNDRISYKSFSSPNLGADCTSIYSSMPPSPVCVSALSPIPPALFPKPHYQLQGRQIPSSRYNSIISSSHELNDYYATITCTNFYTYVPGTGGRSRADSFVIREVNSSEYIQTFLPSFPNPKIPVPLPNAESFASSGNNLNTTISIQHIENDGSSISSISSTGSSILNYRIEGTPQKLSVDELLTLESSSAPSSDHASEDSLPSGGLTSPPHRTRHLDLTLQTSFLMSGDSLESRSGIGIALSPPLFGAMFIGTSSPELQELFFDTQDTIISSPTLEEISTRHFSCSMPTNPRLINRDSLPYPLGAHQVQAHTHTFPEFCGGDSPTLPQESSDVSTTSQISECDSFWMPSPKISSHMHDEMESTYSPTLSMVNFYTMGNHRGNHLSLVNLLQSSSSKPPQHLYHARSFSVPSPMSPIMNDKYQSQYEAWKTKSMVKEHSNAPEQSFRPPSLSLDSRRDSMVDILGIGFGHRIRSFNSQFFLPLGEHSFTDGRAGEGVNDKRPGDLEEVTVGSTASVD